MGNIFYENKKKYNCRVNGKPYFRLSATIDGKRRQVYGDGEKDAQRKLEQLKDEAKQGFDLDKRTCKVGEIFRYWLFHVKRVEVKASSFTRYECTYRTHIAVYDIDKSLLCKLDSATLQKHINYLYEDEKLNPATITETVKVWRMFLTWALDEGYIIKNPTKRLSIPGKSTQTKKLIEVFTEEERERIAEYMEESCYQYREVIKLAFATGMRQGELLALKWADIYDNAIHVTNSTAIVTHIDKDGNREMSREIWNPKTTNAVRVIPLSQTTMEMLKDLHLKQKKYMFQHRHPQSEFVFTSSTGELIDTRVFIRSYQRMLERAGVQYRKFHTIRHTFATEAIRRGVDVKDLQLLLGHSDITMTYKYVQSDNESKRNAIEKIGALM